jgi:hypothetical protein
VIRDDFACIIQTHRRSNNIYTDSALRRAGYTGRIIYLVDDADPHLEKYHNRFGDDVFVFSKGDYIDKIDLADNNTEDTSTITFPRNACFDVAEKLGLTYHIQLDDDYTYFAYRTDDKGDYINYTPTIKDLDSIFEAMMAFMDKTPTHCLAMAQGGDFIGGANNRNARVTSKRKAMNSQLVRTDRRFWFRGRMNEDVNTYVSLGNRGKLFFTFMPLSLSQMTTQSQKGGLTDMYLHYGTYIKSFTTVMYAPSCTKVSIMGETSKRLHHRVTWENAVPKIISEEHQKPS